MKSEGKWGKPLDLRKSLRDPCLAVPLPLAALLDPTRTEKAMARALAAKEDPTILDRLQGQAVVGGARQGRPGSLSSRGFVLSEEEDERLRTTTDAETLQRWLDRAVSAVSKDEVFDDGT